MNEYVMVPVPSDRVQEVYALLAKSAEPPKAPSQAMSPTWTDDEIRRAYKESPDTLKTAFDNLADHADAWVHSDKLYEPLGYSSHQFAGMMGAFGRRVKSRYKKSTWFFEYEWDEEIGMARYRMDTDTAALIQA